MYVYVGVYVSVCVCIRAYVRVCTYLRSSNKFGVNMVSCHPFLVLHDDDLGRLVAYVLTVTRIHGHLAPPRHLGFRMKLVDGLGAFSHAHAHAHDLTDDLVAA